MSLIRYSYDLDGRLVSVSGPGAISLTYNIRNLINGLTGTGVYSAEYDELNRVTSLSQASLSGVIQYDPSGNRTTTSYSGSPPSTYTVASTSNRLISIASAGWNRTFEFDAAGNLTRDIKPGVTECHSYDGFGRLTQFDRYPGAVDCNSPGTGAAASGQYRFNALNQRSYKNAEGVSTRFIYGTSGELLSEISTSGIIKNYIWFAGEIVAMTRSGEVLTVYSDHLSRPSKVVDSSSATRWAVISRPCKSPNPLFLNDFRANSDVRNSRNSIQ